MRVLLVEDDEAIGSAVAEALRKGGYTVDWVGDGQQALTAALVEKYAAVLLDLSLPGMDGLEVLRRLRDGSSKVPILVMTARAAIEERIDGLDAGADDYLVKPFHVGELLARLRALVRRQGPEVQPVLRNGAVSLDPSSREVVFQGEQRRLSPREFAVLYEFLRRPGMILSRAELEQRIYGWNEEVESNAIEFLIHGLRKKLDTGVIKNVRGVGWMIPKEA
jgi:two-component system OmpR family response regulator